jgi:hypothetical protein
MQQITVNELDVIRAREALGFSMGALDTKRPSAWDVYGYPLQVTFAQMYQAYERGGAAHGAVHRILDKCWQQLPRIKTPGADEVTPWEAKTLATLNSIKGFHKLRDLDRKNMIGRYAALIYRIADNLPLREPLVKGSRLVDLVPVFEDQIKVTDWHQDTNAENYGTPKMFQYRTKRMESLEHTDGAPVEWVDVHPSRVQIMAEGSSGDMFDGVPLLRAGFNALVDVEKISGGSAESYLKNSARTLTFEYDANAVPSNLGPNGEKIDVKRAHEEQVKKVNRNQDSAIITQGAKAGVLQTQTSDPTGAFQLAANLFSASVRIPMTILFGAQTGRLASDQDKIDMQERCEGRQENEITPVLTELITRLQAAGLIEAGAFEIEWPPLDTPGDKDKLEIVKAMTAAMREAFTAGVPELFDADEIRKVAGYEPLKGEGLPTEGKPEE